MELEELNINQDQYNMQEYQNIPSHHHSKYISFQVDYNNNNQEILKPYEYMEDNYQLEFNDNNFLFVDQDMNKNSLQYSNNIPNQYPSPNLSEQQSSNLISNEDSHIFTSPHISSANTLSQNDAINQNQNQGQWLNCSQSLSHTDCTSEKSCQELAEYQYREGERQFRIQTIPTEQKEVKDKQNNQFVVKSIVAVDVEKKMNNYEFKYGERPYVIVNPLQGFYFISGDVCIMNTLFSKEFSRFSELNSFKAPVKTFNNLKAGALEIDVNNKRNGLKNFGFLIEKLRSYSSQQTYNFSVLLEKYQVVINDLQQKKELLKDEQSMNFYSNFLEDSYNKFQEKAANIISQIAQNYTFYSYTIHRLNLFNFEMEMRKFGYSEALLALLGLDITQAQQYIWRKGLFDFLDKANIEQMLYYLVAYKLGYNEIHPFNVSLHTFDNLDVFAVNNLQVYMNKDPNNPFLPYNEILLVSVYDVSPTMIKQVMEIRKLTREKSVKYLRDMEEDLSYSMEATIFLEKFYKSASDHFLPSNKRAGYRVISNESQKQQQEQQQQQQQ